MRSSSVTFAASLFVAGVLLTLGNLLALDVLPGADAWRFIDLPVHLVNIGLMCVLMTRAGRYPRKTMVRMLALAGMSASLASVAFRASTLTETPDDALVGHALQFLSFMLLLVGMSASLRVRSGIWTPLLRFADTVSIGLGLGLLVWYFFLRQNTAGMYYGETYGPFLEAAYPMFDLLMVLVLVDHVRLGDIRHRRSVKALSAIVGSFVLGDLLFTFGESVDLERLLYGLGDVLWGFAILGYIVLGKWLLDDPLMVDSQPRANRSSWIRDYAGSFAVAVSLLTAINELRESNNVNEILWGVGIAGILIALVVRQIAGAAATRIWLEGQNDRLQREVERRTADLALKTMQAEAASRAKSEFLANISHELRTPLNAVIGNLALATSAPLRPEEQRYFERATRSADALSRVIGDILEYVKLDTEDPVLRSDEFGLASVFGFLRGRLGSLAVQKSIELRFELAPGVPQVVVGDRYRLSQLLAQLMDNAIKFTDRGMVTVAARCADGTPTTNDRVRLQFSVRDSGIGMTPEQIAKLFVDFGQLDASTSRRYGGAGLGLAICARVVARLGGRIWAESVPGEGSNFLFEVEFGLTQSATEQSSVEAKFAARLVGTRVLLVEDNVLNRELANRILSSGGIDVINAENGREAIDILDRDADIDGVLMDIHMPVMDGYEATRAIRAQQRFRDLPIIAVTANVMMASVSDAMAVGMNDCVPKPLKPTVLFDTMAKWIKPLRARQMPGSLAGSGATSTEGEAGSSDAAEAVLRIPGIDVEKALGQALNDLVFYRRMLRRFVESHGNFHDEFRAAQLSKDGSAALRSAHTLKGNAANIGATTLQLAAERLESACRNHESVEALEQALADTLVQLALVLGGIKQLAEPVAEVRLSAGTASGVTEPLTEQELAACIERIRGLLSDSDPAATELLIETTLRCAASPRAEALRRATGAAERFEFEEALRELESLQ